MKRTERYNSWKYGVVNAIEASEIPKEAVVKSQNLYYRENRWRKLPGLVEVHTTQISANPVKAVHKYHSVVPNKKFYMAYAGGALYRRDVNTGEFTAVYSTLGSNAELEFLSDPPFLYFGSDQDRWRRYDGGVDTSHLGGANGTADDAPKKFSQVAYSTASQRFFGIGEPGNEDLVQYSEDRNGGGMEVFPLDFNQIIESVKGDYPRGLLSAEGTLIIGSQNSIHTGNVVGVPQNWRFQKEKTKTGCYAKRTFKRYGDRIFMLTPDLEVYEWPTDKFVTKGRIKFNINPNQAHLANAEIVDNRYYYLSFESGEAVSANKYHLWIYDILGDAWYGPHIGYNLNSMYWDADDSLLVTGGVDDLAGYVMQHRGKDIKNGISSVHWVTGYQDQGVEEFDKRYTHLRLKCQQDGTLPLTAGQLEVIVNVDNRSWAHTQTTQRLTLEDPTTQNLMGTGQVKDSLYLRGFIQERYARGMSCQVELKHAVQAGDFAFSDLELDFYLRRRKEARAA